MSRTLCTFPGRAGDIAWSLPTVRAIAEAVGTPVDLQIAGEFAGLAPIIEAQPYIDHVFPDETWGLTPPDEWRAPRRYDEQGIWQRHDAVYHLGYRGWPTRPLAQQVYGTVLNEYPELLVPKLSLAPWIEGWDPFSGVAVGFTEEHFELKLGLLTCLRKAWQREGQAWTPVMVPGGRWEHEGGLPGTTWGETHAVLARSQVFLGCCSAPHVLAVAMGVPTVVMEPSEARRNPIFWPLGTDGPQVRLVRGGDGQGTFDARAVHDAVAQVVAEGRAARG